jgi:hypothetical protein
MISVHGDHDKHISFFNDLSREHGKRRVRFNYKIIIQIQQYHLILYYNY